MNLHLIAVALVFKRRQFLADEPTTKLGVTVKAQIIDVLKKLSEESGTAMMLIKHDLEVFT